MDQKRKNNVNKGAYFPFFLSERIGVVIASMRAIVSSWELPVRRVRSGLRNQDQIGVELLVAAD
jgi:hypothetical protein